VRNALAQVVLPDPELSEAAATLDFKGDPRKAMLLAEKVLDSERSRTTPRALKAAYVKALATLATDEAKGSQLLRELVELASTPELPKDWVGPMARAFLAATELKQAHHDQARRHLAVLAEDQTAYRELRTMAKNAMGDLDKGQAPVLPFSYGPVRKVTDVSRGDLEQDLEDFGPLVEQAWAYAEMRKKEGVDPKAIGMEMARRLRESKDCRAFYALADEALARLHDGHARAALPVKPSLLSAGVSWREVNEGVALAGFRGKVLEGRAPARWDLLLEIDGVPAAEAVNRLEKTMPGSTVQQRRAFALLQLTNVTDYDGYRATQAESVRLRLRDASNEEYVSRLALQFDASRDRSPSHVPLGSSLPDWKMLDNKVGYLRVPTFNAGTERRQFRQKLDEAFAQFVTARGLVIDIRGNPGGNDDMGMYLARSLVDKDFVYYSLEAHTSVAILAQLPSLLIGGGDLALRSTLPEARRGNPISTKLAGATPPQTYSGPVVLLTDSHCFSAADCFACAIQDMKRAKIVGSPTSGGAGAPRPAVQLPRTGLRIWICTMRVGRSSGNGFIEGTGAAVDVAVLPTLTDLRSNRDPALEAGLRLLNP